VKKQKDDNVLTNLFSFATRSPVFWGLSAAAGFYSLIQLKVLNHQLITRYFASHPVEYVTTTMFFVGIATLVAKWFDLREQSGNLKTPVFNGVVPFEDEIKYAEGDESDELDRLRDQLDETPVSRKKEWIISRLDRAVSFVERHGLADGLNDELHYLSESDRSKMRERFSFEGVILGAIPILGFLGTVVGITVALGELNPTAIEESLNKVTEGIFVAFDTTTLALALSIAMMFAKFFIQQKTNTFLEDVDKKTETELAGRLLDFYSDGTTKGEAADVGSGGTTILALRKMAESVEGSANKLVESQALTWSQTIEKANAQWAAITTKLDESIRTTLEPALTQAISASLASAFEAGLTAHAERLATAEEKIIGQSQTFWQEMQEQQVENSQVIYDLQSAMLG